MVATVPVGVVNGLCPAALASLVTEAYCHRGAASGPDELFDAFAAWAPAALVWETPSPMGNRRSSVPESCHFDQKGPMAMASR